MSNWINIILLFKMKNLTKNNILLFKVIFSIHRNYRMTQHINTYK